MKIAVVGDIGGQLEVFHDVIRDLGGDMDTGMLPDDLIVIQVGDIVRFNDSADLDSYGCAALADKLIQANNGKYIQLLGNHETPLLGGALHPNWNLKELPESQPIIESWWNEKKAYIGVVLTADGKDDIVITHAGLTRGFMETKLKTQNPREAIHKLNSYVGNVAITDIEHTGGLIDKVHNPNVDTFWALAGSELYDEWFDGELTFNQLHGHSCIYDWEKDSYWWDATERVIDSTEVNKEDRFTTTTHPNGHRFRTVDWELLNTKKKKVWPILVIDGYQIIL